MDIFIRRIRAPTPTTTYFFASYSSNPFRSMPTAVLNVSGKFMTLPAGFILEIDVLLAAAIAGRQ
jgi:hypothetical protein